MDKATKAVCIATLLVVVFLSATFWSEKRWLGQIRKLEPTASPAYRGASQDAAAPASSPAPVPPGRETLARLKAAIANNQDRIDAIDRQLEGPDADAWSNHRDQLNTLRQNLSEQENQVYSLGTQLESLQSLPPPQTQASPAFIYQEVNPEFRDQIRQQEQALAGAQQILSETTAPDDSDLMVQLRGEIQQKADTLNDWKNRYSLMQAEQAALVQQENSSRMQRAQDQKEEQFALESAYAQAQTDLQQTTQEYEKLNQQWSAEEKERTALRKEREDLVQALQNQQQLQSQYQNLQAP